MKWLANWITGPGEVPSQEPDAQPPALDPGRGRHRVLDHLDPRRVAGRRSRSPARVEAEVKDAVDELVRLYVSKGELQDPDGKIDGGPAQRGRRVRRAKLSTDDKLYVPRREDDRRLGCFGCHNIPGFEDAKPIGTPLNDWGIKSPAGSTSATSANTSRTKPRERSSRDGTGPYYQEKLGRRHPDGLPLPEAPPAPELRLPQGQSEKYKPWDDRLRMPQFAWANDPHAVEEVMTFVLGLTGERIDCPVPRPRRTTSRRRSRWPRAPSVLNRYNCTGCHVLEMPKFTVPEGLKVAEAFTDFKSNVRSSYNGRANDYLARVLPQSQATTRTRSWTTPRSSVNSG